MSACSGLEERGDHEWAVRGHERASTPRGHPGDVCRRRVGGLRARDRDARRRGPGGVAGALLARLREGALTADELVRAAGIDPGDGAATLMELELAGQVVVEDGLYRAAV